MPYLEPIQNNRLWWEPIPPLFLFCQITHNLPPGSVMALSAMIKSLCNVYWLSTVYQPLGATPRAHTLGHGSVPVDNQFWKYISSLPGMRLNCAPRRFFLTKENGVLLCIRELRGFSILLRPRQNHFKTSCFPVFCLWRKRLIQSRCLLSSSSPSGQRLGPIPWATVYSPDNKHRWLIWVPYIHAIPFCVLLHAYA